MNIAIVEDEASDREYLLDCLSMYADDTKTALSIATFDNAGVFLQSGTPAHYDLMFLDVYLGDVTGMELAQELRKAHVQSQIVFVTTSVSHAVTSYEVEAAYYLLKPYTYEQFLHMIRAVLRRTSTDEPTIAIKTGRDWEQVPASAILYVDYGDHYVNVHTTTRTIRTYANFKEVEERLGCYPQFLTCYRNMTINMDKVEKLEGDRFVLQLGASIPISRNRLREMREAYAAYIFNRMKRGGTI